jgi:glucose dehydrogenase
MTRPSTRLVAVLIVIGAAGAPALVRSQGGGQSAAAREWTTVSGDLGNTRYSTLTQINAQTVQRLAGAWASPKFATVGAGRAMPVVRDGLLFITAGSSVYAFDARTGAAKWQHATDAQPASAALAEYNRSDRGLPNREGVAVGEGLIFAGLTNGHVIALREKSGEPVWNTFVGIEPARAGQGVAGAPVYANGRVFVGTAGDFGFRGKVIALDAKTGKKTWEWFAIPGPGEAGHDTWPKDTDAWRTGGGAVWLVGAADTDLGLVYFGTGNGVPQYSGDTRAGDNLYLASLVALEMSTGKVRWYYQTIRHDIWEADIAQSPVLFETQAGGRTRKAIAAMRADGYLFMLDRETGKPLMPIEERKVGQDRRNHTAATQPYPAGGESVLPDCDEWKKTQTIPSAWVLGCFFAPPSLEVPNLLTPSWGMRVVPMSFSPQTGYFYAVGNSSLQWFRRAEDPYIFILGAGKVPGLPQGRAMMAAIDSRTGKVAWRREFRNGRPAGALTTAGGLLFQMMPDGRFVAREAKSGNDVWQFETGQAGGGPAASYEIDGEQYIALGLRDNVLAFKLDGPLKPFPAREQVAAGPPSRYNGPIQDVSRIELVSNVRDNSGGGSRYYNDEYAFSAYRARVKAGTQVVWVNNGRLVHTVVAEDGSWTTGRLAPLEAGAAVFDKPGSYSYMCKEHPWAKAELIVVP